MIGRVLYEREGHSWIAFGRDPARRESVIDTNEYLIVSDGEAILLDPGGTEVFPAALSAISRHISLASIKAFFASHQDPDVLSSLPLWMALRPDAQVYLPTIWSGFMAHFGYEYVPNFKLLPDDGGEMRLGGQGRTLHFLPAHYCHSPANFSVYDPFAKILFSGDLGAALLPEDEASFFVRDFDRHVGYMAGFHRRWMPSNEAKNAWVAQVRALEIDMICPQHGAIFQGEDVGRFLDWLEGIEVGHGMRSYTTPRATANARPAETSA